MAVILDLMGVVNALAEINQEKGDDYLAHTLQDELFCQVLGAIAAGAPEAAQMAKAALRVLDIPFTRYYA